VEWDSTFFSEEFLGSEHSLFLIDLGERSVFEHRHISLEFLIRKALLGIAAGLFFGWFMWRIEYDADEEEQ
jgi:hypothetical protein